MQKLVTGVNNLISTHPEVADQWDHDKNNLDITKMFTTSNKKVHWICDKGHTWEAVISSRTRRGHGCPVCSGHKVVPGFNDLETTHPSIAAQWDYSKNETTPQSVSYGSKKKVHWICDQGHEYECFINDRCRESVEKSKSRGCNICAGKIVLPGFNDLRYKNPILASQWDNDKNLLTPDKILATSSKKAWWKCKEGHSWQASVSNRYRKGDSCPYCSGRYALSGFNDLTTTHPSLMSQWSHTNKVDPTTLRQNSHHKIIWECQECGGSWNASIASRTRGSGCPYCCGFTVLVGFNDLLTTHPEIAEQWGKNNDLTPEEVSAGSTNKIQWECNQGHKWITTIYSRTSGNNCTKCLDRSSSRGEKEVADFVSSLLGERDITTNTRSVIPPYELDIYIPEKKIAIEYNGLYWHSEKFIDKRYHYDKWKKCKDQGIQLITIWEDEWVNKERTVKSMLSHKIGSDSSQRVYARKTTSSYISSQESQDFLNEYHIQGSASGSIHIGLLDGNDLVAVSVWRKNKNTLYLDRYATSCTVIGGMGKLLKQGIQYAKDNDCTEIVTFADHQVSNGGLYEKLGFRLDKELKPDYRYLVNNKREHKFGYRLIRFRNDSSLLYEDGMTEKELAELNGLHRIWDMGKSRYVINIP